MFEIDDKMQVDDKMSLDLLESKLEKSRDYMTALEALMRRRLLEFQEPSLAQVPEWWESCITLCRSSLDYKLEEQALYLTRALLHKVPTLTPQTEFSTLNGSLLVTWEDDLWWLIYRNSLPAPAIDVRVYTEISEKPRTFRYVSSAVNYTVSKLSK